MKRNVEVKRGLGLRLGWFVRSTKQNGTHVPCTALALKVDFTEPRTAAVETQTQDFSVV